MSGGGADRKKATTSVAAASSGGVDKSKLTFPSAARRTFDRRTLADPKVTAKKYPDPHKFSSALLGVKPPPSFPQPSTTRRAAVDQKRDSKYQSSAQVSVKSWPTTTTSAGSGVAGSGETSGAFPKAGAARVQNRSQRDVKSGGGVSKKDAPVSSWPVTRGGSVGALAICSGAVATGTGHGKTTASQRGPAPPLARSQSLSYQFPGRKPPPELPPVEVMPRSVSWVAPPPVGQADPVSKPAYVAPQPYVPQFVPAVLELPNGYQKPLVPALAGFSSDKPNVLNSIAMTTYLSAIPGLHLDLKNKFHTIDDKHDAQFGFIRVIAPRSMLHTPYLPRTSLLPAGVTAFLVGDLEPTVDVATGLKQYINNADHPDQEKTKNKLLGEQVALVDRNFDGGGSLRQAARQMHQTAETAQNAVVQIGSRAVVGGTATGSKTLAETGNSVLNSANLMKLAKDGDKAQYLDEVIQKLDANGLVKGSGAQIAADALMWTGFVIGVLELIYSAYNYSEARAVMNAVRTGWKQYRQKLECFDHTLTQMQAASKNATKYSAQFDDLLRSAIVQSHALARDLNALRGSFHDGTKESQLNKLTLSSNLKSALVSACVNGIFSWNNPLSAILSLAPALARLILEWCLDYTVYCLTESVGVMGKLEIILRAFHSDYLNVAASVGASGVHSDYTEWLTTFKHNLSECMAGLQKYLVDGAKGEHFKLAMKRFGTSLLGAEAVQFIEDRIADAHSIYDEVVGHLQALHKFLSDRFHPAIAWLVVGVCAAITAVIGFVAASLAAAITIVICVVKAAANAIVRAWNYLFGSAEAANAEGDAEQQKQSAK